MTPLIAHRLLNAPTATWIAYQTKHPHWGFDIAQCLRANTVSLLGATNNLRKLNDCMADPDIQPLLCNWFSTYVISKDGSRMDASERIQTGLSRCVRSIQLQAIAQEKLVNILPRMDSLAALSGNPLTLPQLWNSFLPDEYDFHGLPNSPDGIFIGGKSLGTMPNVKKILSQYKKFCIDAIFILPGTAKKLKHAISSKLIAVPERGNEFKMDHALLWAPSHLSNALTYALAYSWANNSSPWSTYEDDIKLSPRQTKHWSAWALHAQSYLTLSDLPTARIDDIDGLVHALETCPPFQKPLDPLDNIDENLFSEPLFVV